MSLSAIVAVDRQWAIGCEGRLLYHVPQDLRFFKQMTLDQCILMGRKTFESLPGQKLLPRRMHWILTQDPAGFTQAHPDLDPSRLRLFSSLEALREAIQAQPEINHWVCGGQSLYQALLADCDCVWITHLDCQSPRADAWFPRLDQMPEWVGRCVAKTYDETAQLNLSFWCYRPRLRAAQGQAEEVEGDLAQIKWFEREQR